MHAKWQGQAIAHMHSSKSLLAFPGTNSSTSCLRRCSRLSETHEWRQTVPWSWCRDQQRHCTIGRNVLVHASSSQRLTAAGHIANVTTPNGNIKLGSFLSSKPDVLEAIQEAVAAIQADMGDEAFEPELALVFVTAAYGDGLEEVVPALRQLAPSLKHVFGCTVSWLGCLAMERVAGAPSWAI